MVEQIGVGTPSSERTIASISNGVSPAISRKLRARAVALRLEADQLDELAQETEHQAAGDRWLGLPEIKAHCGMGRSAVQAAGGRGLDVQGGGESGRPIRVRQSELDQWLSVNPFKPRVKVAEVVEDPDAEAMRQLRELARG
jgi:hypothetical protein